MIFYWEYGKYARYSDFGLQETFYIRNCGIGNKGNKSEDAAIQKRKLFIVIQWLVHYIYDLVPFSQHLSRVATRITSSILLVPYHWRLKRSLFYLYSLIYRLFLSVTMHCFLYRYSTKKIKWKHSNKKIIVS